MQSSGSRRLRGPDLGEITVRKGFWYEKIRVNRETTLTAEYEQLKSTHRLDALSGDWSEESDYTPHIFWDSDIAKWLEAAAYSLESAPDAELEDRCDETIEKLAKLQRPDGYLNSYFIQVEPENRWTNLRDRHELYCAGHLMEAAVAYYEATGKRTFLEVMCRYGDYIATVFGVEEGKRRGYPGHEEIELALVKMYKATGEKRYLGLAKYFVDERGASPHYFHEEALARGEEPKHPHGGHGRSHGGGYNYCQAHVPVRDQETVEGHSVRACYLYAGMADVARETGDDHLTDACRTLWENMVDRRMYVHGGIGSCHVGERFTFDYDLPNEEAYAETCAAIALVFFAQRMFTIERRSEYVDVLERALYNGVLSGVSADGKRFFYDNYLASFPGYHGYRNRKPPDRQEWFGCACCPPNLTRLLASLASYILAVSESDVWLNLYADYQARLSLLDGTIRLSMATDYPWDGKVSVTLSGDAYTDDRADGIGRFAIKLRIPGWCESWRIAVNGETLPSDVKDGYESIDRSWKDGDVIEFEMEMPAQPVSAHPSVRHDAGKIAIQRGPILYCLEETDNGNALTNLYVRRDVELKSTFEADLLGGVVTVAGAGTTRSHDGWIGLYRPARRDAIERRSFKAIPYYAWNNRGEGEMLVWINVAT